MLVEVLELVDDDLKWLVGVVLVVVWERRSIVATSCTQSGAGSRPGRTIAHRTQRALTHAQRGGARLIHCQAGRAGKSRGRGRVVLVRERIGGKTEQLILQRILLVPSQVSWCLFCAAILW